MSLPLDEASIGIGGVGGVKCLKLEEQQLKQQKLTQWHLEAVTEALAILAITMPILTFCCNSFRFSRNPPLSAPIVITVSRRQTTETNSRPPAHILRWVRVIGRGGAWYNDTFTATNSRCWQAPHAAPVCWQQIQIEKARIDACREAPRLSLNKVLSTGSHGHEEVHVRSGFKAIPNATQQLPLQTHIKAQIHDALPMHGYKNVKQGSSFVSYCLLFVDFHPSVDVNDCPLPYHSSTLH